MLEERGREEGKRNTLSELLPSPMIPQRTGCPPSQVRTCFLKGRKKQNKTPNKTKQTNKQTKKKEHNHIDLAYIKRYVLMHTYIHIKRYKLMQTDIFLGKAV